MSNASIVMSRLGPWLKGQCEGVESVNAACSWYNICDIWEDIKMETKTLNPDCEIEQLLFHMKFNGIRSNSNHSRILLWLEKNGPGDYSITDIATAIGLSVRQTRLVINLVCCTINATSLKFKYNILVSGKTNIAMVYFARVRRGLKLEK
jgi:hypothetical protein